MGMHKWIDVTGVARWTFIEASNQGLVSASPASTDPTEAYHPLLNPSPEDQARQVQAFKAQWDKDKKEKRSPTQAQYWRKAVELIRSKEVKSYADLGLRFRYTSDSQRWGEPFTEHWARLLVKKMIVRGVFTEDEIKQLIPEPLKPRKRDTRNHERHTESRDAEQE